MKTSLFALLLLISALNVFGKNNNLHENLLDECKTFTKSESGNRKKALDREIETYSNSNMLSDNISSGRLSVKVNSGTENETDWYQNDLIVHNGDINDNSIRPLSLKQGEDGWLYILVPLKEATPNKGAFRILRSSNGGAEWILVAQGLSTTEYFFSFGMLVESRNNNTGDSTRTIVYYTSSTNINGDNAKLNFFSVRRDGTAYSSGVVASPVAGRKYEQVTVCSDGQYYEADTFMHAIVKETSNAGVTSGFHHFRTASWGNFHTDILLVTDPKDNLPCAQFYSTSADSILIAFERQHDANSIGSGIYIISEQTVAGINYMRSPAFTSGSKEEKPCLSVPQQKSQITKKIILTYTYNGKPSYSFSTNGGSLWNFRYMTTNGSLCRYTFCASDSTESGGNNFLIGYVNLGGDSVLSVKGTLGSISYGLNRINSSSPSPNFAMAGCIYRNGQSKTNAIAYVGNSGINAYFDAEHLVTGIQNVSNEVPSGFKLEQNYPNPFNPQTNIRFSILKSGLVTLRVFDITGKEVAVLVNQNLNSGTYNYDFEASLLSSGVYFYRISAGDFSEVKKMVLLK